METALKQGVSRVVDVSTAGIWGNTPVKPIIESTPFGSKRCSQYCETKFLGDQLTRELYEKKGLPLVSVYPVGVACRGDKISYRSAIEGLMQGLPGYVYPNAHMPTVHVQDVAKLISRIINARDLLGEKYLVGNSNPSMRELWDIICDVVDGSKVERELGITYTPIRTAIEEMVAEIREEQRIAEKPLVG